MHTDVVDLREFYDTALGQVARRMIRRRIRELWPDTRGQVVLGVGYATPFLRPFLGDAEQVLAMMPAGQGVMHWPPDGAGRVALTEETEMPLPDLSVDRVLLVHGLEGTENRKGLMREVWRVLAGGGRLLVVVPNRRGIWARVDFTPFGQGRPYSASQLSRTLRDLMFVPERVDRALYIPPVRWPFLLTAAPAWENVGRRWFQAFSGVVMIEASKQLYQPTQVRKRAVRRPRLIPLPSAQPARVRSDEGLGRVGTGSAAADLAGRLQAA
jgi:SAM-dependent methyltransferase